ncbi:MAG: glycosyltransferase family 2 protein [Actinomycetes bacterium]
MRVSCVILTRGDRPADVARAVESARAQNGVDVEVVVVGNGADPGSFDPAVKTLRLPDNIGIPAGRNRGVALTTGDVVLFLDDDAYYASRDAVRHVVDAFAADDRLGIVSLRITDPDGAPGARRHVPRLRAGDAARSSEVTTFLGGACAVRRAVFDAVGGFPDAFFYAHEETDLAWRALDAGYRIAYDADAEICHPALPPTRHREFFRLNARNRVFLARRNLPWPIAFWYLVDWTLLTVVRTRHPRDLAAWFRGFGRGLVEPCGPRRRMRYRTAWRMARLGRPPII